jgi:hypothetical protein
MSELLVLAAAPFAFSIFINYSLRKIVAKVVYYGPGTGPLENLQYLDKDLADGKRLTRVRDSAWWFLPVPLDSARGFEVELHVYAPSSGTGADPELEVILRGSDAIVFVADARLTQARATAECLARLRVGLAACGVDRDALAPLFQVVAADRTGARSAAEVVRTLDASDGRSLEAAPASGVGVTETLTAIVDEIRVQLESE